MNINEYIEKYSTVDVDKKAGVITVVMELPLRREITYKHQECLESQKVKIRTGDVYEYLKNSGMEILSVQKSDSANNTKKLTARWEYNISPTAKKSKKNNRKDNLKKIIEDIG